MSKCHPGQSPFYEIKQLKRKERANERMVLKIAKRELTNPRSEFVIKPRRTKYRSKKLKGGVTEMERGRIRRLKELIWNKFECAAKVCIAPKLF